MSDEHDSLRPQCVARVCDELAEHGELYLELRVGQRVDLRRSPDPDAVVIEDGVPLRNGSINKVVLRFLLDSRTPIRL